MNEVFKLFKELILPAATIVAGVYIVYLIIKRLVTDIMPASPTMEKIIRKLDDHIETTNQIDAANKDKKDR